MSQIVKQLNTAEIEQLIAQLQPVTEHLPAGMRARTKYQGVTISIYRSNKVMFQGQNAESICQQLLGDAVYKKSNPTQSNKGKKEIAHASEHIQYNQFNCIGSDEAGSGDYFGPLTVCACYVSADHIPILKTLGVDDSKRLKDSKIIDLAEQLVTFLPHSLLVLDNIKYNERQSLGWSQVKMKAVLHNECIKNVLKKVSLHDVDYIVIDQFAQPGVYQHYAIGDIPAPEKTRYETKGESKSLSIAAASIISRYAFVKHMDRLSEQLQMTLVKGAGRKVDLTAAQLIERYGIAQLDAVTKRHFANREKALKLVQSKQS
ncbi:ribonuclease HIII [Staphylococcus lutrae]|uniref:Ribonuclease HIII n=1 Tax=Staphylococcus lutrae TaxID=155085 RepID=A0AAC9WJV5_9STAP|nr:ribonuclease HIII [Staphylococcus lutrae]ARJ51573.1 ribonuclease HIII [Staphylococcus lutrae]PNZ34633.1 ribonuclease HIII [Staphylococcus lutrae]